MDLGHALRLPQPQAGAGQRAAGQRPEPLRQVIAAAEEVVPRRQPHVQAAAHGGGVADLVGHREGGDQQGAPHQGHPRLAAGDAVEGEEEEGEDQRRPEVPLQEEEDQHQADGEQRRQQVLQLGDLQLPRQAGAGLRDLAQELPAVEEVAGQEEHDEDLDRLHRLPAEEVHLGVAAAGAAAEEDQHHREQEGREQGDEAHPLERRALVVDQAGAEQQGGAEQHPLGEAAVERQVAQRVADGEHHREADAGQQQQRRQDQLVPPEPPQPPDEVDGGEGEQEDGGPEPERGAELPRGAHHEVGLEGAELLEREERDRGLPLHSRLAPRLQPLAQAGEPPVPLDLGRGDADALDLADVGQAPLVGALPDRLGGVRPLGRAGEDVEGAEQLVRPAEVVQVDDPPGGDLGRVPCERLDHRQIGEGEAEEDGDGGGGEEQALQVAGGAGGVAGQPLDGKARLAARSGLGLPLPAVGGGAAGHGHVVTRLPILPAG